MEHFNQTIYGTGIEGFINWMNVASSNWFISIFIIVVALVGYIVSKRNGLKSSLAAIMCGIIIVVLTPIFQLFTSVNSQIIIVGFILIALGVGGNMLGK